MRKIKIFDTTLRDGEQAPGCSMSISEKLEAARALEALGVDVIEAGFAAASNDDFESVRLISEKLRGCSVASLARCTKGDIDRAWEAIKCATSPRIHIFLATSPVHMQYKLKKTPDEVLEIAKSMTAYARSLCPDVEFSAEDATRSDMGFLKSVVEAVIDAGASTVNIPDTVGYACPEEMRGIIRHLNENVRNIDKAVLSVHCHNDLGMAVANTLAGIQGGAGQFECSINGIGERAGNASLEETVMALKTREDVFGAATGANTRLIYRTSKLIYNIIGQTPALNKPIVGGNAFLHESGIHQHGVLNEKSTYEIMDPESVGIFKSNIVLGKHSGRHAFEEKLREMGYEFSGAELDTMFRRFKDIADKKKSISDGDISAIASTYSQISAESLAGTYELSDFSVHSGSGGSKAVCVISLIKAVEAGEDAAEAIVDVALGDGPVDAAFNAIDKIAGTQDLKLSFYNISSATDGKDAVGEVLVKLERGGRLYNGRGISTDILEASILAYLNAINKIGA